MYDRFRFALAAMALGAAALAGCDEDAAEQVDASRKPISCIASERLQPSLDPRILPGVAFEIVEEDVGRNSSPEGKVTTLFLRHGVEKAKLAGGVDLEASLGGCEYYATSYSFSFPRTGRPASDTAFWLDKTVELIGLIEPANTDRQIRLDELMATLVQRKKDAAAPPFQDGLVYGSLSGLYEPGNRVQEHYEVRVDERADRATLKVQYAVGPL